MDFDLALEAAGGRYRIDVGRPPGGVPVDKTEGPTVADLQALRTKLSEQLSSANSHLRDLATQAADLSEQDPPSVSSQVRELGNQLFNSVFPAELAQIFDRSVAIAKEQEHGLRVRIRTNSPELLAIPWEALWSHFKNDYLVLDNATPIIRSLPRFQPNGPMRIKLPLRILGMAVVPPGLGSIDVRTERQKMDVAVSKLGSGLVKIEWVNGTSIQDLREALSVNRHHVFHFIGHGDFDAQTGGGSILLLEGGEPRRVSGELLGQVLTSAMSLQLIVLNSCQSGAGNVSEFSSIASLLIRRGYPAVLAMQYAITDAAAIAFAGEFYRGLTRFDPIDQATHSARMALRIAGENSLEWATPVLYMQSPNGALFEQWMGELASSTTDAPRVGQLATADSGTDNRLTSVLKSMDEVARVARILRQYVSAYENVYEAVSKWDLLDQELTIAGMNISLTQADPSMTKLIRQSVREAVSLFGDDISRWVDQLEQPAADALRNRATEYSHALTALNFNDLLGALDHLSGSHGTESGVEAILEKIKSCRRQVRDISDASRPMCTSLLQQINTRVQELADLTRPRWRTI